MHQPAPLQRAVTALLAPILLACTGDNSATAEWDASLTLDAYQPRSAPDVLEVAQLVAFSLAALHAVGQSLAPDLPHPTVLRLRSSAAACRRAAESAGRSRERTTETPPVPEVNEAELRQQVAGAAKQAEQARARLAKPQVAEPEPVPDALHRAAWANALTEVAQEYAADIANLPPREKWEASMRAKALSTSAQSLLNGIDLEPYRFAPPRPSAAA